MLASEDITIITYGEKAPDKDTVGKLYLQHYDTDPEVDYVVSAGTNGIWTYRKWKSGVAECHGVVSLASDLQIAIENTGLFYNSTSMSSIKYPFTFVNNPPSELATVQSPGGFVWLACNTGNTKSTSGIYAIISPDKQVTNRQFSSSFQVRGYWK